MKMRKGGVFLFYLCILIAALTVSECTGIIGNLTDIYAGFLDDLYGHLSSANVTEKCGTHSNTLMSLALHGNQDALKILDSSGKPSSGILEGAVSFLGYYSECVHTIVNASINGQYCLIHFNVSDVTIPAASWLVLNQKSQQPSLGVCVPLACTLEDVLYSAKTSARDNFDNSSTTVPICHTDVTGISRDIGAILTLCMFIVLTAISITASIWDYYLKWKINVSKEDATNKSISLQELCERNCSNQPKGSTWLRCLLSFSISRNACKIFSVSASSGRDIRCLHGLKFLSMTLIILGHTYTFGTTNLFLRNPSSAKQAPKDFLSQIFANGTFAVDTFYIISGLLVAYVSLKVMDKDGKLPLCYFYLHRYFRLTPLMFAVIMFCSYVLRYVSSGPNWLQTIVMYDSWCKTNGWINLLYLHNFIRTEHMCLSHSWYLATDMQMYLVAPLILIPLHRYGVKYGAISMGIFMSIAVLTTAIITAINNYPAIPYINDAVPPDVINDYYKNVYIKPYCRIGPYVIGIAVGYLLLNKTQLHLKKRTVAFAWCCFTALCLAVIYIMWPANQGHLPSTGVAAAYSALARNVWAGCIGWLIIACSYGYGGFVNSLLSWRPLVPLSRLTYCAYLIHPVVMNVYYGGIQNMVDFTKSFMVYTFIGNMFLTYSLSLVISLIFESPVVGLEKALLSRQRTTTQTTNGQTSNEQASNGQT